MIDQKRILVIEDDLGLRAALCALFRRAFYRTSGASVREGLRLLRSGFEPDLIIADLWETSPEGDDLLRFLERTGRREKLLRLSERPRSGAEEEDGCLPDRILHREKLLDRVSRMLR